MVLLFLTGKNLTGAGGINITGDIVTTGTITYEDVTNIDSLGIVTARGGLESRNFWCWWNDYISR